MTKDRTFKVLLVVAILAVAGYFIYNLMSGWYRDTLDTAKTEERQEWQQRTEGLVNKVSDLEEKLEELKGDTVPEEKLAEVFGDGPKKPSATPQQPTPPPISGKIAPEEIERQILAFFAYLDDQDYVKAYELEGGSYHQYTLAVDQLAQSLPRVVGEQESLYTMVRNVAHFYRTLGKKRVTLVKEIMNRENEIMESVMRMFFMWYSLDYGEAEKIKGRPSLPTMYQYAGYLLNTLGGRSYLMRRDPKIRNLAYYYCVLILDRANDAKINSDGIDIRPHIKSVYTNISNQIGFIYQKQYLAKLEKLMAKYQL